jgi:hypothetical protein
VSDSVRVMMICSPYKMHLYHSLAKHFPSNFQLKLISAETGYCGKTPLLGRCPGIEFLPARQMMQELVRFRPDLVFTDYPAYPSWYAKLYSYLRMRHIPLVAWLLGDFWKSILRNSQRLLYQQSLSVCSVFSPGPPE